MPIQIIHPRKASGLPSTTDDGGDVVVFCFAVLPRNNLKGFRSKQAIPFVLESSLIPVNVTKCFFLMG